VKIKSASITDFMRAEKVELTPATELILIGGDNAQGKSSVVTALASALGGTKANVRTPVRKGADKAEVVVETDTGLKIRQYYTKEGTYGLKVTTAEGAEFTKGAGHMAQFYNALSFDPLAFTRMDPAKQREIIQRLVGLDFRALDAKRKTQFDLRRDFRREGERLEARLKALPFHADAPEEELSFAEMTARLQEASEHNAGNDRQRMQLVRIKEELERRDQALEAARLRVMDLEEQLRVARETLAQASSERNEARSVLEKKEVEVQSLQDADTLPLREQIASAEDVNRMVRQNRERAELQAQFDQAKAEAKRCDDEIKRVDEEKEAQIQAAKFPLDGLGFDDSGVLLNGLPFEQASSAEQLRASIAIGLGMNPAMRVLLIRDGSLLDEKGIEILREMATQNDCQFVVERVGKKDPGAIVIEDGKVLGAEATETVADEKTLAGVA